MLAISKLTDLISGALSDQVSYQYLLEMSLEKPDAAALNDLIISVLEANEKDGTSHRSIYLLHKKTL